MLDFLKNIEKMEIFNCKFEIITKILEKSGKLSKPHIEGIIIISIIIIIETLAHYIGGFPTTTEGAHPLNLNIPITPNKCQSPSLKNWLYKCKNILTWYCDHINLFTPATARRQFFQSGLRNSY
jgi:hypothetical protein